MTARLVALAAVLSLVTPLAAGELPFPTPEKYVSAGGVQAYVRAAREFLLTEPKSPHAPRVALDLLVVGRVAGGGTLVADARKLLVLRYPGSLQAAYAVTTFKDAAQCREFLEGLMDPPTYASGLRSAPTVLRAVALCTRKFGPELMNKRPFALEVAFLASRASQPALQRAAMRVVNGPAGEDRDVARIARISFDESLPAGKKVLALHGLGHPAARKIKAYFISKLTEKDLASGELAEAVAEAHMAAGRFGNALAVVRRLSAAEDNPRALLWLARCRLGLGQRAGALDALAELQRKHSRSPWEGVARQYAAALGRYEAARDANAKAIGGVLSRVARGLGAMECTVRLGETTIYVGISTAKDREHFELLARDGRGVLLAWRSSRDATSIYARGDKTILRFRKPGPVPAITLGLKREAGGKYAYSMGMELVPLSSPKAGFRLTPSPVVATAKGLTDWLDYEARRHGWIPAGQDAAGARTTFHWMSPDLKEPKLRRLRYVLTGGNALSAVSMADMRIEGLRYGEAGEVRFKSPQWPSLPVSASKEFDPGKFMGMMGKIMGLVKKRVP